MKQRNLIALTALCGLFLPALAMAQDKPVIVGALRNAASFDGSIPNPESPTPQRVGGLAGGSIFVAFGSFLGPSELLQAAAPYPDQLPADAGGTRVTFRSLVNDEIYSAPMIHAWESQVSGIIPSQLPLGLTEATVSYNGMESEPTMVEIVETSPALFSVSQTGEGPAVVQNYESAVSQPLNSLTKPVAPGQYLILWGTGLGPIDGPDNVRPPVGSLREDVVVRFGSGADRVMVPAEYAGRSPEFPGVDQYNVRVPDDGSVELGCYQDVSLEVGSSGFGARTTVAISDTPGACDHPWGLSPQQLADLDAGGTMNFLHMVVSPEFIHAKVAAADALGVSQNPSVNRQIQMPFPANVLPGASACSQGIGFEAPEPPGPLPARPVPPGHFSIDLGGLELKRSDGGQGVFFFPSPIDPIGFGPTQLLDGSLIPGEWTLSAPGGADVPAFETMFDAISPPEDILPEIVDLAADLEITWDGSAYHPGDRIEIRLQPDLEEPPDSGTKILSCRLEATDGSLTITPQDFAWLEVAPGASLKWTLSAEGSPYTFTAEALDHGQVSALVEMEQAATVVE